MSRSKIEPGHLLDQPWPDFLEQLDSAPDAAFEAFCLFATRLLTLCPPGPLRTVPPQDRMDLIHEVILGCRERDFQVLRRYRNEGRPFAAWFLSVARNRIVDLLRSGRFGTGPVAVDLSPALGERHRDGAPLPDQQVWAVEMLDAVARCVSKMGLACRLLLQGAADGIPPRQLTQLLSWPADWNKKASDDLRACRKRLVELLREEGLDVADLGGLADRAQGRIQRKGTS